MEFSLFYQIFNVSLVTFFGVARKFVLAFVIVSTMQAYSFMEKWHKCITMEKNLCGSQVDFFIRRVFFSICLETIETLEGHFNLMDAFLMLDGFKNCKVMVFKFKFYLNESPQNLLDWHENEKNDKIVINFLKIYE